MYQYFEQREALREFLEKARKEPEVSKFAELDLAACDVDSLADPHLPRRLDALPVDIHVTPADGRGSNRARLEETCGPKPFVYPYASGGGFTHRSSPAVRHPKRV